MAANGAGRGRGSRRNARAALEAEEVEASEACLLESKSVRQRGQVSCQPWIEGVSDSKSCLRTQHPPERSTSHRLQHSHVGVVGDFELHSVLARLSF